MNRTSILRRPGNKKKLIADIMRYAPRKRIKTYLEPFAGTCAGVFYMMNRVHKVFANDSDEDVINLWDVLRTQEAELRDVLQRVPYHQALFERWKTQQEPDPLWKAVRFLILSNWSFMGQADTLRHDGGARDKAQLLKHLDTTIGLLEAVNIDFLCCDFREFFDKISWRKKNFGRKTSPKAEAFAYFDPPYFGTGNIYHDRTCKFTEQDTADVFDVAMGCGIDFMISEFDGDFVRGLADDRGLHITPICERRTMNNRNVEIIITNYKPAKQSEQIALFAG